jgi:hypothetical protein
MNDEVTYEQAWRMSEQLRFGFEVHLAHCKLCIKDKWYCPDANRLQENHRRWQRRMADIKAANTQK